jgi:hypothetical protein
MARANHAVLVAPAQRPFRVLQAGDFHSDQDAFLNERTRHDMRAFVELWVPDLIVAAGDIWCGDEHPEAAPMWRHRDLAFFGSLGVPWTFIQGNHDWMGEPERAFDVIRSAPGCIMPAGDGRGNHRIELRREKGGDTVWDLFFLNAGLEWRLPGDLAWFEAEVRRLNLDRGWRAPAVCWFHIPLRNYQEAIDEGRTIGAGNEKVLHWGDDAGLAAGIFKRAGQPDAGSGRGNVRACFCAHSHENDFHFIEDGVIFGYGRATGWGGYGAEVLRKGATLIELDAAGAWIDFRTVFADGSQWRHEAGSPAR